MPDTDTHFARLLRRNVSAVAKIEASLLGERSSGARRIRWAMRGIGTPASAMIHGVVFASWIGLNTLVLPVGRRFDPPPFAYLELTASIEAILLGIFILASQNRLQQEENQRSHLGLQVNMLAETETTKVLHMLDQVRRRLGIETDSEEDLIGLKASTDPETIVETLKTSMPGDR